MVSCSSISIPGCTSARYLVRWLSSKALLVRNNGPALMAYSRSVSQIAMRQDPHRRGAIANQLDPPPIRSPFPQRAGDDRNASPGIDTLS